jgi:nicotinate-nucleotide adenylyltransferase
VTAAAGGGHPSPPRLGILGGSFDPPHVGHVLLAQDALDDLALDRLLVIPSGTQPLKGDVAAPAAARLAMVQAAFAAVPRVTVEALEIERGGLSFMVDTVDVLRRRWPDADFHLILGADAAADLARWREPDRLLRLVQLVIADRGQPAGSDAPTPWRGWPGIRPPRRLTGRRVDVSSSEIRARVASGLSIRGFVPDAVAVQIATSGLYLPRNAC